MKKISSLSKKGTTASTYSVASSVRESLKNSGFQSEKIAGIGKKKQILKAVLESPVARISPIEPWFSLPKPLSRKSITILGSGLAGASVARALAERDWRVTVLEPLNEIAPGASGNPAGVFMPHLASEPNDTSRFSIHAFQTFLRWFDRYGTHCGHASHVLEMNLDQDDDDALIKSKRAIGEHSLKPGMVYLAGDSSLLYSTSGWISPKKWCEQLLNHPLIQVHLNSNLTTEEFTIIALGNESMKRVPDLGFKMKPIKGQILSIPETAFQSVPWQVHLSDAYSIPYGRDLLIGATFEQRKVDSEIDRQILDPFVQKAMKGLGLELKIDSISHEWKARASIRAMTPDKLPIVGPLPNVEAYQNSYHDLYKGKRSSQYPSAIYDPGHMVLSGLGSRGITYACSSAELIADLIEGNPLGMDRDLYQRVHPARFIVRAFKSRKNPK